MGRKKVIDHSASPVVAGSEHKDEKHAVQQPVIADEEWHHASRALKTAGWGALFYLITTDVLGPYTVP